MFERQGLPDIFESFDARRVLTGNSLILQFSQPVTRKQRHRHLTTRSFVVSLDGADLGLEAGMQSTGFPQLPSDFLDGLGNNYLVVMDRFAVVVEVVLIMDLSGQMALVRIGNGPFANGAGGARVGSSVDVEFRYLASAAVASVEDTKAAFISVIIYRLKFRFEALDFGAGQHGAA